MVQRANYLFKSGFGNYNLVRNNCEDFAIYCKTGLLIPDGPGRSGQIAFLVTMFPKIGAKYFLTEESVKENLHKHGVRWYAADIGVRDDVIYVPAEDCGWVADNPTEDDDNGLRDDDDSTHEDDENDLQGDEIK